MSSNVVIQAENVSKLYRLGTIGSGTIVEDMSRFLDRIRGKNNSYTDLSQTKKADENIWALKDISFEVNQGEVLGIIGRNGAGKSTLLKILSQITQPTSGEIRIKGKIASLLEVGTGFHPELSGRENIFLNGAILGMRKSEIKKKFDEIVDFSGVEKFIDTPVKRYSSGMYVRLAFAVAAHLEPDILIVDEVLAVGDAEFQKKCIGKMKDVSGQGRTVLFVSHNTVAVRQLCNRAILLKDGIIISDDSVDQVLNMYQNSERKLVVNAGGVIMYNENRRSSGHIQFSSVEIHDINKKNRYKFLMGESIQFTLSYEAFDILQGIEMNVRFFSGGTKEMLTSIRHIVTKEHIPAGTKGKVTLELSKNPFRPGEYPLCFDISCSMNRYLKYETLDDVTNPIVIVADENESYRDFNPLTPVGFFSVASSKIVEHLIHNSNSIKNA